MRHRKKLRNLLLADIKKVGAIAMSVCMLSSPMQAFALNPAFHYHEGTFTGTGIDTFEGSNETVQASVTLKKKASGEMEISALSAVKPNGHKPANEDYWYDYALPVLQKIKEKNGTEGVDAATGATFSTKAIIAAVDDALASAVVSIFDKGTGTETSPYEISSVNTLKAFAASVNAGISYKDTFISLTSDIDLTGEDWIPIGSDSTAFSGIFYGNGHTISNMTIGTAAAPSTARYAGLFGYTSDSAVISDLNLQNLSINIVRTNTGIGYVGGLIGFENGYDSLGTIVNDCHVQGSISVDSSEKDLITHAGGLIGNTCYHSVIANSGADVDVSVKLGMKKGSAAGFAGLGGNYTLYINNYAAGDAAIESSNLEGSDNIPLAAGFVAMPTQPVIYNCYASGNARAVSGASATAAFIGDVGYQGAFIMHSCYNSASGTAIAAGETDTSALTAMSAAEMTASSFAGLLNSGLSYTALSDFKAKVAGTAWLSDFSPEHKTAAFYDQYNEWVLSSNEARHGSAIYEDDAPDPSLFASGNGTSDSPFVIKTGEQLVDFANSLTSKLSYSGYYIKLENDIDLTSKTWPSIGRGVYAFNGVFDGNGKTVTGLTIGTATSPYVDKYSYSYGLFSIIGENGLVKDFHVNVSQYITSNYTTSVGAVAGRLQGGTIDSVSADGKIVSVCAPTANGNGYTGGIVGETYKGIIINCSSSVNTRCETGGGMAAAGGIVGFCNRGLVANCCSTGMISGNSDRVLEGAPSLGGISGVFAGTMVNCYSLCDVVSDCYAQEIGALVGWGTGIAQVFQSYFSENANIYVDKGNTGEQKLSPVAIGWAVGPGTGEEGLIFDGTVSYHVESLTTADLTAASIASRLNANLDTLDVDLTGNENNRPGSKVERYKGSGELSASLKTWSSSGTLAMPDGNRKQSTYNVSTNAAVQEIIDNMQMVSMYDGTFYGRSKDKSVIVTITTDTDEHITHASVISGNAASNQDALIQTFINDQGTKNLPDGNLKEALDSAVSRAQTGDYTEYLTADSSLFAGGNGTKESPWIISNETQLTAFAHCIGEDESYEGKYIGLSKDISLTGSWTPAGSNAAWSFRGHFDGKNHTISNLRVGGSQPMNTRYGGLFTYIEGGSISNLKLINADINIINITDKRSYAGILSAVVTDIADKNDSLASINNVSVSGKVTNRSDNASTYAGGIIGYNNYSFVTNCTTDTAVTGISSSEYVYCGGIAGLSAWSGLINDKISNTITSDGPSQKTCAGGIAGMHASCAYNIVSNANIVSVKSTPSYGLLAGNNTSTAMLRNCYFDDKAAVSTGGSAVAATAVNYDVNKDSTAGVKSYTEMGDTLASVLNANTVPGNADYNQALEYIKSDYKIAVTALQNTSFFTWSGNGKNITMNRPAPSASEVKPAVKLKLSGKKISRKTVYYNVVRKLKFKAAVTGTSEKVSWKSSKPSVASVNANGIVTIKKKAGKATITASAGGAVAKCVLTVKAPSIKLSNTSMKLKTGKKYTLKATLTPKGSISYQSSNKKVASVSKKGVIKAKKKGKATITVTANGIKKTCKVTVTP